MCCVTWGPRDAGKNGTWKGRHGPCSCSLTPSPASACRTGVYRAERKPQAATQGATWHGDEIQAWSVSRGAPTPPHHSHGLGTEGLPRDQASLRESLQNLESGRCGFKSQPRLAGSCGLSVFRKSPNLSLCLSFFAKWRPRSSLPRELAVRVGRQIMGSSGSSSRGHRCYKQS